MSSCPFVSIYDTAVKHDTALSETRKPLARMKHKGSTVASVFFSVLFLLGNTLI